MKKYILIFISIISLNLFATNYYVDFTNGDDAHPGTLAEPWKTCAEITTHGNDFVTGDSILLKRGEAWRPASAVGDRILRVADDKNGGANYIVFGAYGTGAKPILSIINMGLTKYAFGMDGGNNIIVQDIEFRGGCAVTMGTSGVHHIKFLRCTFEGDADGDSTTSYLTFMNLGTESAPETYGLKTCGNIEVGYCTFNNNYQFTFNNATSVVWVHHNTFINHSGVSHMAIQFAGGDSVTVEYNKVYGAKTTNYQGAIKVQPQRHTMDYLIIRYNLFIGGSGANMYGIGLFNTRYAKVYNNTVVVAPGTGAFPLCMGWQASTPIYFTGIGTWGSNTNYIENNILYGGAVTLRRADAVSFIYTSGRYFYPFNMPEIWTNNYFKNNIYSNPGSTTLIQYVAYVNHGGADTSCVYSTGSATYSSKSHTGTVGYCYSTNFGTSWNVNANCVLDISAYPQFIDSTFSSYNSYGNKHVKSTSPANTSRVTMGYAQDLDGKWSDGRFIGCYDPRMRKVSTNPKIRREK